MQTQFLTNPLASRMALPLAILLVAFFSLAAIALMVVHIRQLAMAYLGIATRPPSIPGIVLWQRYLTWAIIAPLFTLAALGGPLAVALLCAFLCWQGGREYAALTGIADRQKALMILGGWAILASVLLVGPAALEIAPVPIFFGWSLLALSPVPGKSVEQRFSSMLAGLWGSFYIGWLPAYLVLLSASWAPGLLMVVGLGVALSDVGAFCFGKAVRGPKLAPGLSPNKTWGGVLGNVLGATLAVTLTSATLPDPAFWQCGLIASAISIGSIWGDLLESLLKRQAGVKDAGKLLPGFGGLLDRIDSLLLAAPLVYGVALPLIR